MSLNISRKKCGEFCTSVWLDSFFVSGVIWHLGRVFFYYQRIVTVLVYMTLYYGTRLFTKMAAVGILLHVWILTGLVDYFYFEKSKIIYSKLLIKI